MEYKKIKLGEVIDFKNGKKRPKENGTIPIYGGNGILGYTNKFNSLKNSIIIGRVGAYCGCVYKNDNQCWVSDNAIVGYAKEDNDYMFLYYCLKAVNLNNLHIGSSHPLMTQDILNNIEINIPTYNEQKKIGKILIIIDKKIELNNKINDNLLKLIDADFDEVFVDIEHIKRADELADITIGKTPPRAKQECFSKDDKDIKWLSISDIGKCGVYVFDTTEKLTQNAINDYNVRIIPEDTIVLSFKLTVGRVAITNEAMATNEAIAHFNLYDKKFRSYIYMYLRKFDYNKLGSTSSIATAVNSKIIKAMPIKIPDEEKLESFNKIADNILKTIRVNEKEIIRLEQLRDTLLPKLMNGEIDLDKIEI